MSSLCLSSFKEAKKITFMLRKPTNLPDLSGNPDRSLLAMVHKGDKGKIFVEDSESKIMHVGKLSHADMFYFMIIESNDGIEEFHKSNGRTWEKSDNKEKMYEDVPEKYKKPFHKWKYKYIKRYINTDNVPYIVGLSLFISILILFCK